MTVRSIAVARGVVQSWVARRGIAANWRLLGQDMADYYRLRRFDTLVPGYRALLYTVLGYAAAGQIDLKLIMVNTLVIGLLFMFFGAYDNYWDWRLLGEQNGTRAVIERRGLSQRAGLFLACVPYGLTLPLMGQLRVWRVSWISEAIVWLLAALGFAYMTPGIRLKSRRLSFFMAPAWACLLFLQAAFLSGTERCHPMILALSGAIFALQCQAELLHRLDDGGATAAAPALRAWLYRLPWIVLGVSLAAAWWMPLLLNTAVWWLVRLWALRRVDLSRLSTLRRQVWHPVWSLYEFGIYAAAGIMHRLI